MTYFILQTLFWLLLAFIVGLILGKWLKRLLCNKTESQYQLSSTEGATGSYDTGSYDRTERTDKSIDASYTDTADKLAFRDHGEYDTQSNQNDDISAGTATAAGIATAAAVTGAAGRSLTSDDEVDIDKNDDVTIDSDISVSTNTGDTLSADVLAETDMSDKTSSNRSVKLTDDDIEVVEISESTSDDDSLSIDTLAETDITEETSSDDSAESTVDDLLSKSSITGAASAVATSTSLADENTNISGSYSSISGIDSNNLQIIEGIGPKMQDILNENGVHTWQDLSMKSEADIRAMLDKYGDQYKGVEDVDSWIVQAKLAADGDVNELIRLQKIDGTSKLERKFGITGSDEDGDDKNTETTNRTVENNGGESSSTEHASKDSASDGIKVAAGGAVAGAAVQGLMGSYDDQSGSSDVDSGSGISGIESNSNLQIIEGIGPAMEKVLKENGINTWADLGSKSEADVQAILDQYGDKYQLMQPASWITEAKLAAAGDVDELIRIQKIDGISKLENMMQANANRGFSKYKQNDLQIIEGIGPKIAELLNKAGINSWAELANTDTSKLQAILDAGGSSFKIANPSTWAEQAALANAGEWTKLKTYQDFLEGGVAPTAASVRGGLNSAADHSSASASSTQQSGSGIAGIDSDSNLQIIEGIGPAMERVLNENGINTWSDLGSKTEGDLLGILGKYGNKYKLMQPGSWIAEAKLAAAGDVTELIRIQKVDGISKLENLISANIKSGFGIFKKDDLQIVEGIGPKIAGLLNDAGIQSWHELANTDIGKIQGILDAAGSDFQIANPTTWAEQAGLADSGEWHKLKEYQDFLDGGRSV